MRKFTVFLLMTRNGPTYGEARELCTPPLLTNTWVQVSRSGGRWTRGCRCAEVATGWRRETSTRSCDRAEARWRASSGSVAGLAGSVSPGTASPSPYTKSAGEAPMSGFRVVRMANIVQGSRQNQSFGESAPNAIKLSLRRRWNLSTRPFASG